MALLALLIGVGAGLLIESSVRSEPASKPTATHPPAVTQAAKERDQLQVAERAKREDQATIRRLETGEKRERLGREHQEAALRSAEQARQREREQQAAIRATERERLQESAEGERDEHIAETEQQESAAETRAEETHEYSGSGDKNLGAIQVAVNSLLQWSDPEGSSSSFSIRNDHEDEHAITVEAFDESSGQTAIEAGRYHEVEVEATGAWTIKITPAE